MHEIGPLALFTLIGWIAWLIFTSLRRYQAAKLQASLQMKLLEKIDCGQTALAYAETDAGRQFLQSLAVEREEVATPHKSILSGVRWGIMFLAFGIAFFCLRSVAGDHARDHTVIGTLLMALGAGFELAAAATYFLSRSFGLLKKDIER
jgi:hypothetical protein